MGAVFTNYACRQLLVTNTKLGTSILALTLAAGLGYVVAFFLPGKSYFDTPTGVAQLVDGATYTGEILDGQLHGKGDIAMA